MTTPSASRTTCEPAASSCARAAGTYANVPCDYRQGNLKPGDVEEAVGTVEAVGDFEYLSPQHHGTPDERREAWLTGYRSGDPTICRRYLG